MHLSGEANRPMEKLITNDEVARLLGYSKQGFINAKARLKIPYVRPNWYRPSTVQAWMAEQERKNARKVA